MPGRTDGGRDGREGSPCALTVGVSWRFIALATAGVLVLITAFNISVRVARAFYVTVYEGSGHLITPTLIGGVALFAATVIGLTSCSRLRPNDIGWRRSTIGAGLAMTAGVWIAMQLVELIAALAAGEGLRLSPSWSAAGWATAVGLLLGQALGIAPAEETFFRGFLLPQLGFRFSRVTPNGLVAATVLSNVVFAVYHLPNLAMGISGHVGTGWSEIAVQLGLDFLVGVVYAVLYLRTANLFLVIGIHALQNGGPSIPATPIDPSLVVLLLTVVIVLATFTRARGRLLGRIGPSSEEGCGADVD